MRSLSASDVAASVLWRLRGLARMAARRVKSACGDAARRAGQPAASAASATFIPSLSPFSAKALRQKMGPLSVKRVASHSDVDDFATSLMAAYEDSCVTRSGDLGAFAFPCYVVAVPEDGLCFDLMPIALDPQSEMIDLERLVLSEHAKNSASRARADAKRL